MTSWVRTLLFVILLCLQWMAVSSLNALSDHKCGNGVLDSTEECERNFDCKGEEFCNAVCECTLINVSG